MSDSNEAVAVEATPKVAIPMPKGKRSVLVFAILAAVFAQMFMTYSLTTAAVTIVTELNGFQWYAMMFSLATMFQCVFTPASTPLARIFTQRRVMILGVILMIIQFLGTYFAVSVPMIVISRCLGHIGAAFLFTVGIGMFADLFPPKETSKYTGYYGMIMSLCGVVGPIVAGVLCDNFTWRWLPLVSLVVAILAVALLLYAAPKVPHHERAEKTDTKGVLTLSVFVIAVVVIISFAGTYFAWASITTAVLVIVAIVFFVLFLRAEKAVGASAFMPLDLLKNKVFLAGFLLGFFGDGAAYVLRIYIPAYGQVVMYTSATYAALLVSIPSILAMIISFAFGHWLAKTGRMKFSAILGILCQIACCLFVCIGTPDTNQVFYLIVITVLFGFVNGIVAFIPLALVQARMPHKHVAVANAVVMLGVTLGSTIVVAIAGMIQNMGMEPLTTYRVLFIVNAILTAIILPFLFSLRSDKKANEELEARAKAEAAEDDVA